MERDLRYPIFKVLFIIALSVISNRIFAQQIDVTGTLCINNTVSFAPTTLLPGTAVSTWDFGDNTPTVTTTGTNKAQHSYITPGTFTVSETFLTASGAPQVYLTQVTIAACEASFIIAGSAPYCQFASIKFTDLSNPLNGFPILSRKWDFGDGTPATTTSTTTLTHIYANVGTYTVTLTLTLNVPGNVIPVSDSYSQSIIISPSPISGFATTYPAYCPGAAVAFVNVSVPANSTFNWNFTDPNATATNPNTSTSFEPSHIYSQPNNYIVTLTASNGTCGSIFTNTVTIFDVPKANFSSSSPTACTNDTIHFTDQSVPTMANLSSWRWTISTGTQTNTTLTTQNPSYVFTTAGNYNVSLTVTDQNKCSGTITKPITAYLAPTGLISVAPNQGKTQGYVLFSYTRGNNTTGPQYWDFGNGETSLLATQLVHYTVDSNYKVSLVLYNSSNSCTDTLRTTYPFYYKGLYIPNALAPNYPDDTVRLFKPAGINLKEYNIEIYNRWGNLVWKSNKLVGGKPSEAWDGTLNGTICQEGVYVWKVRAIFKDNTIWTNTDLGEHKNLTTSTFGSLLLIR